MIGSRRPRPERTKSRGQSMVEYAISVPVFLLVLLGMLEFGFAFSHHLTMEYSTREGARTGAALAHGTLQFSCDGVDDDNVDNQIIAAVQRVLTGAGAQIDMSRIGEIRIYKADSAGRETGSVNVWEPGAGPSVDGVMLRFGLNSFDWSACGRDNEASSLSDRVDSIGVSISYDYDFVTPLGALMRIAGGGRLHMTDRTVMALNPTPKQ